MAADGGSLAARTDLKDARGLRGHPILVNAIAIAGTPWLMLAKMDQDDAHAGIRTTAWITGIVTGLLLLLLYGAGYLLWRQAAARLAGLGRGVRGLGGGGLGIWGPKGLPEGQSIPIDRQTLGETFIPGPASF